MRTIAIAALLLWSSFSTAAVLNVEFHFAPYTGDLKKSSVQTVPGKAAVYLNNVLIAEQPVERLARGVFEHQHGSTVLADQRQRPHGPSPVQLILQRILVSESIEAGRCRLLRGGRHDQNVVELAVGVAVARRRAGREVTGADQVTRAVVGVLERAAVGRDHLGEATGEVVDERDRLVAGPDDPAV